jgi:hypothetical protein
VSLSYFCIRSGYNSSSLLTRIPSSLIDSLPSRLLPSTLTVLHRRGVGQRIARTRDGLANTSRVERVVGRAMERRGSELAVPGLMGVRN